MKHNFLGCSIKNAMSTTTASATSLNFIGFEDAAKNNTSPLIYDQVYIQYDQPSTAGRYIHPVAGFLPGQQSFLKPNVEVFNRAMYAKRPSASLGVRMM